MSIRLALTKATTDSLGTVSSAASMLNHGISSLDHLAALGAAHAKHHRERAERSLALDNDELEAIAEDDARHRLTLRKLAHAERIKDPEYARIFNSIEINGKLPAGVTKSEPTTPTPVAAPTAA
jgi:hypothetical protein